MTEFLKDILNQPSELRRCLGRLVGRQRSSLEAARLVLQSANQILIIGIGASWHAGMAVLAECQRQGRPATLVDASELLYFGKIPAGSALLMLSRSGRSIEIVQLLKQAQKAGVPVVAVTNASDSPLGTESTVTISLGVTFDKGVSVTTYTAVALAGRLAVLKQGPAEDQALASSLDSALAAAADSMGLWRRSLTESSWLDPACESTCFLARDASQASCHEARLLWQEGAKLPALAMSTGAFRHGPQEMIRPGMRFALWIDGHALRSDDLALARDLRTLESSVLVIGADLEPDAGDLVLNVPPAPDGWQFLVDIMPLQIATEQLARIRGVDCDSFRYCSYVVETEGGLL